MEAGGREGKTCEGGWRWREEGERDVMKGEAGSNGKEWFTGCCEGRNEGEEEESKTERRRELREGARKGMIKEETKKEM